MLYGDGALISLTTLKSLLLNLKPTKKKNKHKNISLVTKNYEKTVPYENPENLVLCYSQLKRTLLKG